MPEISIVDTKNIIHAVKFKHGLDLGHFPISLLRFKLDRIIKLLFSKNADFLITRLIENADFYNEFIQELYSSDIELFRDPEFWIKIKDKILPEIYSNSDGPDMYIPDCMNPFELYSLIITVEEIGLQDVSKIYISYFSKLTPKRLFSDIPGIKEKELSFENLFMVFPGIELEKYFNKTGEMFFFKKEKLENIHSFLTSAGEDYTDQKFQLILFRDQLINFNTPYQEKKLKNIIVSLDNQGIIILGYKDSCHSFFSAKENFINYDEMNRVYQKINS